MPGPVAPAAIDAAAHLDWALGIARGVVAKSEPPDPEEVEGVVIFELVERCRGFEPARVPAGGDVLKAFRGYAHKALKWAALHEVQRQRDGHHSRAPQMMGCVVVQLVEGVPDLTDGHEPHTESALAARELEPWLYAAMIEELEGEGVTPEGRAEDAGQRAQARLDQQK